MRSGPAKRCASYCTWSSRSRTIVLESAEDQWRIPVMRGNFDSSCAVAGELVDWPASDIESTVGFAALVEFAAVTAGATVTSWLASVLFVLAAILSVRIIALLNCAVFNFHHTPAANALATTMLSSKISTKGLRVAGSDCGAETGCCATVAGATAISILDALS